MHKRLIWGASALASLFIANAANASQSSDMSVTAKVLPSSCNVIIANGGTFNYGDILSSSLANSGETIVADTSKTTDLSVLCSSSTRVAIKMTDNRAGTAVGSDVLPFPRNQFGLGHDAAGNKVGTSYLYMSYLRCDQYNCSFEQSTDNGLTWRSDPDGYYDMSHVPGHLVSFHYNAGVGYPSAVSRVEAQLHNYIVIAPKSDLDLSHAVHVDGSATLELVYL